MSRIRRRLTYANVMSTIAAFLAIGGASAFAAVHLGRNSVGTEQLKWNSVTSGKLAPEAVRAGRLAKDSVAADRLRRNSVGPGKLAPEAVHAGRLAKNSVVSNRLRDNSVNASKIVDGTVGTKELADGAVSASKLGAINVRAASAWIGANSTGQVNSPCKTGERLIGSGAYWSPVADNGHSIESMFDYAGNTAVVRGNNVTAKASVLTVQAICLG